MPTATRLKPKWSQVLGYASVSSFYDQARLVGTSLARLLTHLFRLWLPSQTQPALCNLYPHLDLRLPLRLASLRCHLPYETMPMAKMAHFEENWFCLTVPWPSLRSLKSSPVEGDAGGDLQCCRQLHKTWGQDHSAWHKGLVEVNEGWG